MKNNLPNGVEVYSNIISNSEADYLIDIIDGSRNKKDTCDIEWGIPELHSPDISCLRNNKAISMSHHAFLNNECSCGIRQAESLVGKLMLKCLEKYVEKYGVGFTQDEGFTVINRGDDHVEDVGVDDNPFVNRILSLHFPLNPSPSKEYLHFPLLDYGITLSSPSIVMFPSNFIFRYSKPRQDDMYEIINFFNDNPDQEFYENVFGNKELS